MADPRADLRTGVVLGLVTYGLWGVFPLYFPLLEPAGSMEILACRILFSAVVVGAGLLVTRRVGRVRALSRATVGRLAVGGVLIAVNWGTYIWATTHDHVVEASLGYFINPLVTAALGVLVLHERLRRVQYAALSIGALAVVVVTVSLGRPPYLSLVLAFSFGSYGLVKKTARADVAAGLFVETCTLAVPALVLLLVLGARGTLSLTTHGPGHAALLASAGVVTAGPLLLFAGAARRLPLTTIGLMQFVTPVLQFAVGVLVRHEPVSAGQLAGFGLVWVALVVLSTDALRHRTRRPAEGGTTADPAAEAPADGRVGVLT